MWKHLPIRLQNHFREKGTLQSISKKQMVYQQNETPHSVYFVESGLFALTVDTNKGHRFFLRLFKKGKLMGYRSLIAEENFHASAVAIEDCLVLKIPKNVFWTSFESSYEFQKLILKSLAQELKNSELKTIDSYENDVQKRLCQSLIFLDSFNHRFTRAEIAQLIGSTAPTVIRMLAKLEEKKLIEQSGREILILNREGLLEI